MRLLLILKQGSREITRLIHTQRRPPHQGRDNGLFPIGSWKQCGGFSRCTC